MKNCINYKGLDKKKIGFIKSKQLKRENIDTIILNEPKYWNDIENNFENLKNVKNIIIDNKRIKTNEYVNKRIVIQNTRAENIYLKDQVNLGGLTIPVDYLTHDLFLQWFDNNKCNIKEINLLFPLKENKIIVSDDVKSIDLFVRVTSDNIKLIHIFVNTKYKEISYSGNINSGIIEKVYNKYTYSNEDVVDGILDLRNINKTSRFSNIDADLVIIKKEDLFNKELSYQFNEKINIGKLKIIDNNNMKLNPETGIVFEGLIEVNNYFITDREKTKFIYLDKNDELKVLYKDKMLENEEVEDVQFINNNECELVIIKYKNKTYKIIDKNGEYLIDDLFNNFIYLNINSYDFYKEEIIQMKKIIIDKEWYKPFLYGYMDNNILGIIYNDYLIFIKRIKELKELGFTDKAIKYLINKKYDNIINTKSNNILNIEEIGMHEIKLFNYMSYKANYEKINKKIKKRLYEKEDKC